MEENLGNGYKLARNRKEKEIPRYRLESVQRMEALKEQRNCKSDKQAGVGDSRVKDESFSHYVDRWWGLNLLNRKCTGGEFWEIGRKEQGSTRDMNGLFSFDRLGFSQGNI